jgi:general secretion pathway protein D
MLRLLVVSLAILALGGCAAQRAFDQGRELIDAGKVPEGLAKIDEAYRLDPQKRSYREYYFKERDLAVQRGLIVADKARAASLFDQAETAYQQILLIDSANPRATAGLEAVRIDRRHRAILSEAEDSLKKGNDLDAQAKLKLVLSENSSNRDAQLLSRRLEQKNVRSAVVSPQLGAALKRPITIEFRDAPLRTVFEMISKNSGLNFLFDRDVRPDLRTTLFVRNTSIEDVIRFILVTNQLERKVLSENTLLVYPNTAAKAKDYQELVMRSFFLANADAKQVANMVKTLVKTKDMYIDEKLNSLVIRDTPEAVRVVERLIANSDLAEPEVVLEVEVLEVSTNLLTQLGIRWPVQASASVVGAGGAGTFTLDEARNRNAGMLHFTVTDPFLIANLQEQISKASLLANPRIRVKNKEKAKVHIGDRVPVITTTTTSTGVISESVNYLDVGLKLDVEPNVFLEDDVGIKIGLEVSAITATVKSASGTTTYQIGTRNANTVLRLKDGETQALAGLIDDEDRRVADNVPGLGDLPVLGRLFSNHNNNNTKTEIVLLITPHIVRNIARPELRFEEFASGTESVIGAPPLVLQTLVPAESGAAPAAPTAQGQAPAAPGAAAPDAQAKPQPVIVQLQAPAQLALGQEFAIQLTVEGAAGLKSGAFDIAYDPSRLEFVRADPGKLLEASPDAGFRANSPEGMGRLSLSFSTQEGVQGAGEVARLTFRAMGAPGTPGMRLETVSLTDDAGKTLSAQLPPPLSLLLRPANP